YPCSTRTWRSQWTLCGLRSTPVTLVMEIPTKVKEKQDPLSPYNPHSGSGWGGCDFSVLSVHMVQPFLSTLEVVFLSFFQHLTTLLTDKNRILHLILRCQLKFRLELSLVGRLTWMLPEDSLSTQLLEEREQCHIMFKVHSWYIPEYAWSSSKENTGTKMEKQKNHLPRRQTLPSRGLFWYIEYH
ncbi:hypothetical protein STEG23_001236, partial [Scotinomys teguina]